MAVRNFVKKAVSYNYVDTPKKERKKVGALLGYMHILSKSAALASIIPLSVGLISYSSNSDIRNTPEAAYAELQKKSADERASIINSFEYESGKIYQEADKRCKESTRLGFVTVMTFSDMPEDIQQGIRDKREAEYADCMKKQQEYKVSLTEIPSFEEMKRRTQEQDALDTKFMLGGGAGILLMSFGTAVLYRRIESKLDHADGKGSETGNSVTPEVV